MDWRYEDECWIAVCGCGCPPAEIYESVTGDYWVLQFWMINTVMNCYVQSKEEAMATAEKAHQHGAQLGLY